MKLSYEYIRGTYVKTDNSQAISYAYAQNMQLFIPEDNSSLARSANETYRCYIPVDKRTIVTRNKRQNSNFKRMYLYALKTEYSIPIS